jgi:allantoinase
MKAGDDFLAAWGGITGCQTTRGLLLAEDRLSVPAVAAVTATNAARRFRLAGKGGVEVGCDADLAIVDLTRHWELQPAELRYRHRVSPYVGRRLRGRTVRTMLRGRTVQFDGDLAGPPSGRLVARAT